MIRYDCKDKTVRCPKCDSNEIYETFDGIYYDCGDCDWYWEIPKVGHVHNKTDEQQHLEHINRKDAL